MTPRLLALTVISYLAAYPQTVPPSRLIAPAIINALPVEAEAVKEPLTARSARTQQLRRTQLLAQLNRLMATRDTSIGLVVQVTRFDPNRNEIPADLEQKLAQIAAIVPEDVNIRIRAYTTFRGEPSETVKTAYKGAEMIRDVLTANDSVPRSIEISAYVTRPSGKGSDTLIEIVISGKNLGLPQPNLQLAHDRRPSTQPVRKAAASTPPRAGGNTSVDATFFTSFFPEGGGGALKH
jgi:hypothetical protein